MKNIILLATLLAGYTGTNAQTGVFKWQDVMCNYESTFDTRKVTLQQLKGAYLLASASAPDWYKTNFFGKTVTKVKDIERLSLDNLKAEYAASKELITKLHLPKTGNWERYRQDRLKIIEERYELKTIIYKAYLSDPAALYTYKHQDSCMIYYADAINKGGEALLEAWYKDQEEFFKQNNFTSGWELYIKERESEDRYLLAKIRLLTYGWYNCANRRAKIYENVSGDNEDKRVEELKKLFLRTKKTCDYP